ncbi:MAG: exonuclease subunit SbcD [Clostridiales bacterium]|nr:exonuclease subunit SbcD [Clostridiales bacterium]
MRFIHTSDWHLGRSLHGRKRYDEFAGFLDWLGSAIETERVEALLVAGDVFDTTTPSNRAQELYYGFLGRVAQLGCCRHVVVVGGNHDSPSFLNAPREMLRAFNVHVVGAVTGNPDDEVIVLSDIDKRPQAIVCAVPYLRDTDIRKVEPGETLADKNAKLIDGIRKHYADVCAAVRQRQDCLRREGYGDVPIIGMGHLFTAGGQVSEGDGVRELYVGSLAHVGNDVFLPCLNYVALGHLHGAQCVGGSRHVRYCGSPIAMGYGEAGQDKKVLLVELAGDQKPVVSELVVPCFKVLERVSGTLEEILGRIEQLKREESSAWLEVEYTDLDAGANLRETIEEAVKGTSMELLQVKTRRTYDRVLHREHERETLDDLNVSDVFERCLDEYEIASEEREELKAAYSEIVRTINEEDINAE